MSETSSGAVNRPIKKKPIKKKIKKVVVKEFPSHAEFCRLINS